MIINCSLVRYDNGAIEVMILDGHREHHQLSNLIIRLNATSIAQPSECPRDIEGASRLRGDIHSAAGHA